MNYTYGLSIIKQPTYGWCNNNFTNNINGERVLDIFKDNQATSFGGVPYTYEMLNKLRFFKMDLPSLKTMTQAGGKLSPELHYKLLNMHKTKGKDLLLCMVKLSYCTMAYLPYEKIT
jgi:acyl-coenzyme A synthetase/AMP-(fatty) acid ligase